VVGRLTIRLHSHRGRSPSMGIGLRNGTFRLVWFRRTDGLRLNVIDWSLGNRIVRRMRELILMCRWVMRSCWSVVLDRADVLLRRVLL